MILYHYFYAYLLTNMVKKTETEEAKVFEVFQEIKHCLIR